MIIVVIYVNSPKILVKIKLGTVKTCRGNVAINPSFIEVSDTALAEIRFHLHNTAKQNINIVK